MNRLRLAFFGTPREAVPFLEACARGCDVAAVVTRPDKPSGRGLELRPPPVKEAARRLGISVLQPVHPSEIAASLRALRLDLGVVVAYGRLLKPDVLGAARLGLLNVHFSLLPKYRGAAPVAWSLIRGETESGVTLFWLDEGLDTGPVQLRRGAPIGPDEDAALLMRRLTELGVSALEEALVEVASGRVVKEPQRGESSLAPKLTREDARLDYARPAREVHDLVRGLAAGPRAFMAISGPGGRVLEVAVLKTARGEAVGAGLPGTILRVERGRGVLIQCSSGQVWLVEVQPEGKKPIAAAEFINGLRLGPGGRLSAPAAA